MIEVRRRRGHFPDVGPIRGRNGRETGNGQNESHVVRLACTDERVEAAYRSITSSKTLRRFVVGISVRRRRRLRRESSQLREKRRWPRAVGKRGQRSQRVFLTNGQPGADRVRIDADSLELVEQIREPFCL